MLRKIISLYFIVFFLVLMWSSITTIFPLHYSIIVIGREAMFPLSFIIMYCYNKGRLQNRFALRMGLLFIFAPIFIAIIQAVLGANVSLLIRGIPTYTELGLLFATFAYANTDMHRRFIFLTSVVLILSSIGIMVDAKYKIFIFTNLEGIREVSSKSVVSGHYRPSFLLGGCTSGSLVMSLMIGYIIFGLQNFSRSRSLAIFHCVAIMFGIVAIALTLSRVGMGALCIITLGTIFSFMKRGSVITMMLLAITIAATSAYLLCKDDYISYRFSSMHDFSGDNSNVVRTKAWESGIVAYVDSSETFLFGNGLGVGKAKGVPAAKWKHYESSILLVATEGGVFLLFIYLLPGVLWAFRIGKNPSLVTDMRTWNLIAYYAVSFVSPQFVYFGQLLYFALITSYAYMPVQSKSRPPIRNEHHASVENFVLKTENAHTVCN